MRIEMHRPTAMHLTAENKAAVIPWNRYFR